jgi:hypothetical protein
LVVVALARATLGPEVVAGGQHNHAPIVIKLKRDGKLD